MERKWFYPFIALCAIVLGVPDARAESGDMACGSVMVEWHGQMDVSCYQERGFVRGVRVIVDGVRVLGPGNVVLTKSYRGVPEVTVRERALWSDESGDLMAVFRSGADTQKSNEPLNGMGQVITFRNEDRGPATLQVRLSGNLGAQLMISP